MRTIILSFLLFIFIFSFGQNGQHLNVLFIGNSYTEVNNLPGMIADLATSTGDTLTHDRNTPGGCTFYQHTTNESATKIANGGWDYVVLQEQSQIPSFPIDQVESDCFPYAAALVNRIRQYNTNGTPVFYMTWGRKNGDADNCPYYPPLCTYEGMDSLLYARYMIMANDNKAAVSPVGYVRHYLRTYYPSMELYDGDESHPSFIGTYVAACTFYTILFQKDPTLITNDKGIDANLAQIIRNAAKTLVYDSLSKWNVQAQIYAEAFSDSINKISQTKAVVYGHIIHKNIGIKESGIEYKMLYDTLFTAVKKNSSIVVDTLVNLKPNHDYVFRTYCQLDDNSLIYGEDKPFHTLSITVTTDTVNQITDTTATALGSFVYDGDTLFISTGFEYKLENTNNSYSIKANTNGLLTFSTKLNNLIPDTNYQVRAWIHYGTDTLFGQIKSFTTLPKKQDSTQIADIVSLDQIVVFPNPVKDKIQLKLPNNKMYTVELYTMYGQLLKNITVEENNFSVDFSSYSSGIYYIRITDKNCNRKTFKVIKQ